jgi:hypothetical protein
LTKEERKGGRSCWVAGKCFAESVDDRRRRERAEKQANSREELEVKNPAQCLQIYTKTNKRLKNQQHEKKRSTKCPACVVVDGRPRVLFL